MGAFSTTIRERRSIRRYLPQPVPEALIREVIADACWAPSWGNTQSASAYVLSGEALAQLKTGLLETGAEGSAGRARHRDAGPWLLAGALPVTHARLRPIPHRVRR